MSTVSRLIVREMCTGCANIREREVDEDEYLRLRALPISERAQHDDCFQSNPHIRREWVAFAGRSL